MVENILLHHYYIKLKYTQQHLKYRKFKLKKENSNEKKSKSILKI